MTTIAYEKKEPQVNHNNGAPPLEAGDYLTRPEFERRYHAHPELKKAELIEGVVYMPSPVRIDKHGDPHFDIITFLGTYRVATPGVRGSDNGTVRFDLLNEPQPDALLRLDPAVGGNSWIDGDGYLQGAPELVVEIAASSASYDLHQKKATYARHGVQEYLVFQMNERQVSWFTLRDGNYEMSTADADGIFRSRVFPGLWLHAAAFWADKMATVLAVLQQGLASPEHQAFLEELSRR
ncbi:MAG: Uma2 family endonuclease [Caldilineaceae bacterium]